MKPTKEENLRLARKLIKQASAEDLEAVIQLLRARLGVVEQHPNPVGAPQQSLIPYKEIRRRRKAGETLGALAKAAGISRQRISVICKDL